MIGFNTVVNQFVTAGMNYAAAIQPYALGLFIALLLIDILATWIQFIAEGQLDPSFFLGRLIKHLLSAGFVYLMIVNAFPWMSAIVQSFSRIGATVSGLPALSPQSVLTLGGGMAETIFDTPASASLMNNFELAIVQSVAAFFVLLSFVIAAAVLTLTLVEAYLIVGGGVILLGFGVNRFTAPAAEGYFGYVIRVGVRLLFLYLVLGVGVQMATQWAATLTAACAPTFTTIPWWTTYGVPPASIVTTVCSNAVPSRLMLDLVALSVLFLIVTIAVPFTAASVAGGTIGLALSHAFEAAFITRSVVRPITSVLQTGFNRVSQIGSDKSGGKSKAANWVNAMDFAHRTQQISNLGPDQGPRVPAPTGGGSTTRLNGAPTQGVTAPPTTVVTKATPKT
jgi:type IV secretion system protein TrbL